MNCFIILLEKNNNINHFSNNKHERFLKSEKPFLYFKNIFKQNGPIKELNNSLRKIDENGPKLL